MKNIILGSLILFSATSFASNIERCGVDDAPACSPSFRTIDAYKLIEANENDSAQAKLNFRVVTDIQKQHGLNLQNTVENFVYLQAILGGVNATDDTKRMFQYISANISSTTSLDRLINEFVRLYRSENDLQQAQLNFGRVIDAVKQKGLVLEYATDLFLDVLELEGGANATDNAQNTFKRLVAKSGKFTLEELFNSYATLLKADNDRDQSVRVFLVVLEVADLSGNLAQATADFVEVLQIEGGANGTENAIAAYKLVNGI